MNDSLYIAATGMQAQQTTIDTVAANLANVNTPGFKKGRVSFHEMIETGADLAATTSALPAASMGIAIDAVGKDFTPGQLQQTGRQLDLAISGDGFLEVTLADGSRAYSRGGTLQITKDSYLADAHGQVLKPAIYVPSNTQSIKITNDGKIFVQLPNQAQPTEMGQIELVQFQNPSGLRQVGSGTYQPTEDSGEAVYGKPGTLGLGTLVQGSIESSNVSLVDEMVTLMTAQRAYELSSKVAQTADELMSLTNNLRR